MRCLFAFVTLVEQGNRSSKLVDQVILWSIELRISWLYHALSPLVRRLAGIGLACLADMLLSSHPAANRRLALWIVLQGFSHSPLLVSLSAGLCSLYFC